MPGKFRSAVTGRYVSAAYALTHPFETVREEDWKRCSGDKHYFGAGLYCQCGQYSSVQAAPPS